MPDRRMLVALYVALYLMLTFADAWSTALGLAAGGREFNHHVAAEGGLAIRWGQFMALNASCSAPRQRCSVGRWPGSIVSIPLPARAVARVAELDAVPEPISAREPAALACSTTSLAGRFARREGRSPPANNLLIAHDVPDVVTPIARAVLAQVDGVAGYWVVIFVVFHPFLDRQPVRDRRAAASQVDANNTHGARLT